MNNNNSENRVEIQIKIERPPNWAELRNRFKFPEATTIFTYGDCIYNPGGVPLEPHVILHEMVHMEQQRKTSPEEWYKRYMEEPDFLISQEAEAYQKQFEYIKSIIKDRNRQARILHELASFFASSMYGKPLGYGEAIQMIKYRKHDKELVWISLGEAR